MKYRVEYQIYEEVEANSRYEAVEEALKKLCGVDYFLYKGISEHIVNNADVYELKDED